MANLKIVCKPDFEGGYCHPADTKIYIDGVLQEDVVAVSFGIAVDDIFSEVHLVKQVQSVEIEIDGLEVKEETAGDPGHLVTATQILQTAGIETCEKCGHQHLKFVDQDGNPAKLGDV